MGISVTNLIRKAFASIAGGPYIQNPIPNTTATPGRASFEQGFPAVTMTAKVAGGIPPFGQDMNGILYMITNNLAGLNAGQVNVYDATFASDIGGYAKGAMLGMADGTGWWINLTAANTTDPDANGAGWAPVYRYDWTTITGLVGGTRTLTKMEARSRFIVLQGVLGSNQAIELPTDLREWVIINETTGAFTLTCKTTSGTGVTIANGGGSNATQVYGNGTNIYYSANPIAIAADQGAVPLTLAQRTAAGALVAFRFDDLSNMVNTFGARSLTANGSYTFPGGFTVKWGTATANANGDTTVTYPTGVNFTAYTTLSVPVVSGNNNIADQDNGPGVFSAGTTSFVVRNSQDHTIPFWWIAVGY